MKPPGMLVETIFGLVGLVKKQPKMKPQPYVAPRPPAFRQMELGLNVEITADQRFKKRRQAR